MWFNSFSFLCFFVAAFTVYWAIPSWRARKLFLLGASYYFYSCWNPPFVLLLVFSSSLDYVAGRALDATASEVRRKALVAFSCLTNFGVLVAFKYSGFLLQTWQTILPGGSAETPAWIENIVLPVGISFYTFHGVSYIVDVYRRRIAAKRSLLDFFLFVAFFPQLVAGPILRASSFMRQLESRRHWSGEEAVRGLFLIVLGLFQKIAMADNLAPLANAVFDQQDAFNTPELWLGTYAFAFQIYFDFAGYSNIAIGTARLIGFEIPENFRMPYIAAGFREFWRRWHISLSSWFRDYLYIALGGSRVSRWRTSVNLFAVMALCGLWHGANWTFVIWGVLHFAYLAVEHALEPVLEKLPLTLRLSPVSHFVAVLITFHLTCLAWVYFRATSVGAGTDMVLRMLSFDAWAPTFSLPVLTYVLLSILILTAGLFFKSSGFEHRLPTWSWACSAAVMFLLTVVTWGDANEFIYFQF